MNYVLKRQLYENLPGILRAPARWIPFSWIAGRSYRETVQRGAGIDSADRKTIAEYQERSLRDLLLFACDQVPAYRRFKSIVERSGAPQALNEFPLLDKETLQRDMAQYLPRDFERIPHYSCTTGGTSGSQLELYVDNDSQSVEMGFMHRLWSRVGYHASCRKATFRGVEFRDLKPGVFWQANPVYNELQFSPYHMNEATLGAYIGQIRQYRPEFLHGYPSAISLLAAHIVTRGISLKDLPLKAVLLGSEALLPGQRENIERAFGARAFSWYGHSERVIFGGECEKTSAYHQFPDYGILEIIKEDGTPASDGETGELVGTGLLNRSLPLIRYRTGDLARRLPYACECGRSFDRFDRVEGRWKQEYVIGKTGSRISMAALNVHGPELGKILRYQFHQHSPGAVEFRMMTSSDFTDQDLAAIRAVFARKTGAELDVQPVVVPDIPLTGRGKLRRLIQDIRGIS